MIEVSFGVQNDPEISLQIFLAMVHVWSNCKHVWPPGKVPSRQVFRVLVFTPAVLPLNSDFVEKQFCVKLQEMLVASADRPFEFPMRQLYGVAEKTRDGRESHINCVAIFVGDTKPKDGAISGWNRCTPRVRQNPCLLARGKWVLVWGKQVTPTTFLQGKWSSSQDYKNVHI